MYGPAIRRRGFQWQLSLAVFLRHIGRHGARAIAASGHFTAILIENLHKHITGAARGLDDQKLVTALRQLIVTGCQMPHMRRVKRHDIGACVNNDKVIAQPIHFAEAYVGVRVHGFYIGLI